MTSPDILVIGEALVDVVRDRDGVEAERVGGSPLNVAVGLGRLGRRVTLATELGTDRRAESIRAHLHGSVVDVLAHPTVDDATSTAVARIRADGSAEYEFALSWTPDRIEVPRRARAVHTGSIAAAMAPGAIEVLDALERARPNALISFDPNVRPALMRPIDEQLPLTERFFGLADVVKLSDEDADWLYGGLAVDAVADRILSAGAAVVVITRGADGELLRTADDRLELASDSSGVVDTIGAGDSFMAGLIHGILSAFDREAAGGLPELRAGRLVDAAALQAIGDLAHECSAITVRRAGADLPWLRELTAF